MKNNFLIIVLMLSSFVIFSCKKTGSDSGIQVNAVAPTVSTNAATNISSVGATVGGNISSDGGSIVTEAGICYGTASGVDTSSSRIANYTVSGNYNINLK